LSCFGAEVVLLLYRVVLLTELSDVSALLGVLSAGWGDSCALLPTSCTASGAEWVDSAEAVGSGIGCVLLTTAVACDLVGRAPLVFVGRGTS